MKPSWKNCEPTREASSGTGSETHFSPPAFPGNPFSALRNGAGAFEKSRHDIRSVGCCMTAEGDIVLVYYQEKPSVYARVESITPDVKKDWYRLRLLLLTIPAQEVTWILRGEYINGDPFTMGGESVRLEKLAATGAPGGGPGDKKDPGDPAKVIPFRKK